MPLLMAVDEEKNASPLLSNAFPPRKCMLPKNICLLELFLEILTPTYFSLN
jgi:hypothetical protein